MCCDISCSLATAVYTDMVKDKTSPLGLLKSIISYSLKLSHCSILLMSFLYFKTDHSSLQDVQLTGFLV